MRDIDILIVALKESADFLFKDLGMRLEKKLKERDKEESVDLDDEIEGTYGG